MDSTLKIFNCFLFFISIWINCNGQIAESKLIGSWYGKDGVGTDSDPVKLLFGADHAFQEIVYLDSTFDQDTVLNYGTYKLTKNILSLTFSDTKETISFKIIRLYPHKLITRIQDPDDPTLKARAVFRRLM